jgi:hypothetical protein
MALSIPLATELDPPKQTGQACASFGIAITSPIVAQVLSEAKDPLRKIAGDPSALPRLRISAQ